jgi:hypothetical protein
MAFDPLDKKWQVSQDFPPDKTDTWLHPIEKDGKSFLLAVEEHIPISIVA